MRFAVNAGIRAPGVRIPCKFNGSAALNVISSPFDEALADRSQQTDRFRQRKLFATYSANEITAANFSARFPSPINSSQLVPRNGETLSFEQSAKHNSVTAQQNPCEFFNRRFARAGAV